MDRSSRPRLRIQPIRALSALRKLIANPDDTSHVFTIIESLAGAAPQRSVERFHAHPEGQGLMRSRARIVPILIDRAALERMPRGSLAEAYLAFIDREGITADGLVEASKEGESGVYDVDADLAYFADRMRDTHDLWHAVTGYHGDVKGELALLAFSAAQTKNPGVALIVIAGLLRWREMELTKLVWGGFQDGRRAEWLPAVRWEDLLALPLSEVRARLNIEPVVPYAARRTSDLRASGDLAPAMA